MHRQQKQIIASHQHRSGLASEAVSPEPSLSIKTDRLWRIESGLEGAVRVASRIESDGSGVISR